MTKHTEALLDLSKLISPTENDKEALKTIVVSPETPWEEIIDFANRHLLIPTLYSMMEKKDLLGLLDDDLIAEYLETVYGFNRARNESILLQLQDICDLFAKIDVTPVLLKGAAALSEKYYPSIGARVMSDIDILVPEDKIKECIALLESEAGYKAVDEDAPLWQSHQYRRIYSENGAAALELHYHALIEKCRPYLTDEEVMKHVRTSSTIKNAYVLEPSFDLYHIFLHSELQDSSHENHTLPLRGLYHAATIVTACQNEIDWDLLSKKAQQHKLSSIWGDYLYMLNRLFNIKVPPQLLGNPEHFQKIIDIMESYNVQPARSEIFFNITKEIFSYERLKAKYEMKSRFAYPFVFVRSLYDLSFKYILTSKSRKRLVNYLKGYMKSKQFGSRTP